MSNYFAEEFMLIDTHAHLCSKSNREVKEIIQRAVEQGVNQCICIGAGIGNNPAERAVELAKKFSEIYASVGVHPHEATKEVDISKLRKLALQAKVIAIGETGLDYFKKWSPVNEQHRIFRDQIRLALELSKPLIIHCREALEDTLKIIDEEGASRVGGVFHCYSGSAQTAKELRKRNFIVSFTGIITFKNGEAIRKTIRELPSGTWMLETDCPYLAPEPYRGKECEPWHVRVIAERIAREKNRSLEEVARESTETAHRLFGN